jgi:two-component system chemotaxis response regulator CheY
VLIVDDSATMRTLLRRMHLSMAPRLNVFEARDGQHALEVSSQVFPQIILLDWDMPDVSGIEFLKRFTRHLYDVVIGMVTANHSPAQQQLARELGSTFIIAKPFTRKDVHTQLSPYLFNSAHHTNPLFNTEAVSSNHRNLRETVLAAINGAVRLPVELTPAPGHEITGSTGVVASFTDINDNPSLIISIDWALCGCLHAALSGKRLSQSLALSRNKRTTPDMRENIREILNILRGSCQLITHRDMQFDALAFRGDGHLRHTHWQQLLTSSAFHEASLFSASVKIAGMSGGQLSVHILPQVH